MSGLGPQSPKGSKKAGLGRQDGCVPFVLEKETAGRLAFSDVLTFVIQDSNCWSFLEDSLDSSIVVGLTEVMVWSLPE